MSFIREWENKPFWDVINSQSTVKHESEEMKEFSNTILLFPFFVFQIFLTENSWKGIK